MLPQELSNRSFHLKHGRGREAGVKKSGDKNEVNRSDAHSTCYPSEFIFNYNSSSNCAERFDLRNHL